MNKLRIAKPMGTHRSIHSRDPKSSKISFSVFSVYGGVAKRAFHLLHRLPPAVPPVGIIALGDSQELLFSLSGVNSAFNSHKAAIS